MESPEIDTGMINLHNNIIQTLVLLILQRQRHYEVLWSLNSVTHWSYMSQKIELCLMVRGMVWTSVIKLSFHKVISLFYFCRTSMDKLASQQGTNDSSDMQSLKL